jgi:hypothetical protein
MSLGSTLRFRLRRPVFLFALLALIAELGVRYLNRPPRQPLPLWATLLPVFPLFLFVAALEQTIRTMDELQKRICIESAYFAFLLTLVLTFVFAGLDRAGIYHASWDDIGTPMMFLWGCAYVFSAWRYR